MLWGVGVEGAALGVARHSGCRRCWGKVKALARALQVSNKVGSKALGLAKVGMGAWDAGA